MSSSFKHRYFILSGSVHPIFSLHRIFEVELLAFAKDSFKWLIFHGKEKVLKIKYFLFMKILASTSATLTCNFLASFAAYKTTHITENQT